MTPVEAGEIGGTCLNEGCIPTKAFCRTAALLADLSAAEEPGVAASAGTFDFAAASARKDAIVAQLKSGVETLLANPRIRLVKGMARFVDAHTVAVGDELHTADDVIIATGSVSASLPIPGQTFPALSPRAVSSPSTRFRNGFASSAEVSSDWNSRRCSTRSAAK